MKRAKASKGWWLGGICFVAIAAAAAAMARGEDSEKQKQALVEIENRWLHSENDPEALEKILGGDFVHALPIGFISKEEHIGYVRSRKSRAAEEKKHSEDLRVRVYGTVGIVNGIVVAEKVGAAARKTVFTDVFVLCDGRWQAVNAQENLLEARSSSASANSLGGALQPVRSGSATPPSSGEEGADRAPQTRS